MKKIVNATVWLIRAGNRAYARKWVFLGIFLLAFSGSASSLGALDLLPNWPPAQTATAAQTPEITLSAAAVNSAPAVELPMKIAIPKISLTATIANPTTTVVETLDRALLSGAVRYPTSAKLGETGNVVLFGHSSYLPVVGNQAYKTFNGIQKLSEGDVVMISSLNTAYTYRVRNVAKESANDAGIPLDVSGRVLTLATCDSFGAKTDRFVVTADFVESHSISS